MNSNQENVKTIYWVAFCSLFKLIWIELLINSCIGQKKTLKRFVTTWESIFSIFCYFQELSSTFARLCHLVDETTTEMRENMTHIERTLKQLQEVTSKSKDLRGKASGLESKFQLFDQSYLRDNCEWNNENTPHESFCDWNKTECVIKVQLI